MSRTDWGHVLDEARGIVESYDTLVTLRQLFYRLVARLLLPNVLAAYKGLSRVTAAARRDDDFPDLEDRGRSIQQRRGWASPQAAIAAIARTYRRDRTEGQPVSIYLAVEKAGIVNQLNAWFSDLGLPILALGGYASQSFCDEVRRHAARQNRPAVLIGATDHDPTGWDIWRDFVERTDCWVKVIRIALDPAQVESYGLPEAVDNDPLTAEKLEHDSRAKGFQARFGRLTQVELDALPPDDDDPDRPGLRQLYAHAIDQFWDTSTYEAVLAREAAERDQLQRLAQGFEDQ
jgi:hypothetical protein